MDSRDIRSSDTHVFTDTLMASRPKRKNVLGVYLDLSRRAGKRI